jgi:GxxExxY protein
VEERGSDPVTEGIIGAAIEVHRYLGPGLLESVYEEALCHELSLRGIPFVRQQEVDVIYKDIVIKNQRLDLLVDGKVVVELKSTELDHPVYKAQILSYLKACGLHRGLILNFGKKTMIEGISRVVNGPPS